MICEDNNIMQCRRNECVGVSTFKYELNSMVAFELSQTDSICLKNVPLEINLYNVKYEVVGLIEFQRSAGEVTDINNIGHYRAHCPCGTE